MSVLRYEINTTGLSIKTNPQIKLKTFKANTSLAANKKLYLPIRVKSSYPFQKKDRY